MISKKLLHFFVSLMEATSEPDSTVTLNSESDTYNGYFDRGVVNKLIGQGAIELVDDENSLITIIINERQDFLSGFAAGASAARNNLDQSYAEYNANQFAFSLGYEHYIYRAKKCQRTPYNLSAGYVCHGFICDELSTDIYKQP